MSDKSSTIRRLREHLAGVEYPDAEYAVGEIVKIWPGDYLAIVASVDPDEGDVKVYYEEDGVIRGPSFGWELTKVNQETGEPL